MKFGYGAEDTGNDSRESWNGARYWRHIREPLIGSRSATDSGDLRWFTSLTGTGLALG